GHHEVRGETPERAPGVGAVGGSIHVPGPVGCIEGRRMARIHRERSDGRHGGQSRQTGRPGETAVRRLEWIDEKVVVARTDVDGRRLKRIDEDLVDTSVQGRGLLPEALPSGQIAVKPARATSRKNGAEIQLAGSRR